jgi:hypothetical protein
MAALSSLKNYVLESRKLESLINLNNFTNHFNYTAIMMKLQEHKFQNSRYLFTRISNLIVSESKISDCTDYSSQNYYCTVNT